MMSRTQKTIKTSTTSKSEDTLDSTLETKLSPLKKLKKSFTQSSRFLVSKLRCAYCHDTLGPDYAHCFHCHTLIHIACIEEHGSCICGAKFVLYESLNVEPMTGDYVALFSGPNLVEALASAFLMFFLTICLCLV